MATSDSEDFESADEWVDEGKAKTIIKEVTQNLSSDSSIKLKQVSKADEEKVCSEKNEFDTNMVVKDSSFNVSSGCGTTCLKNEAQNALTSEIIEDTSNSNNELKNKTWKLDKTVDDISEEIVDLSLSKETKYGAAVGGEIIAAELETDGWECEVEELDVDVSEDALNDCEEPAVKNLTSCIGKDELSGTDSGGWGSWGSWGVKSILSTATESVSTLTNHVSQGISTVIESGLGVPNPEELAELEIKEKKELTSSIESDEIEKEDEGRKEDMGVGLFGFDRVISGVSSITKLVETASTKVVSGGLDTLETIGKKTMEVLQEGDPGLRKKRAIFNEKVVLSQVLREAKDKAEEDDKRIQSTQEARKVHFETLFDDYHGLVHLEALEMLSKQCNIKLQSLILNTPSSETTELQESLIEIKELCDLSEDEEPEGASFEALKTKLAVVGKDLGVPVANDKFVKTWEEIYEWIQELRNKQQSNEETQDPAPSAREIYQKAIDTLARLTAESVEQYHKIAELLLVCDKRKPKEEVKILLDMTSTFSLQVSTAATVFSEHLNLCPEAFDNPDVVNSHITNIFLEATNSGSYIQEAFQLLVPVLQIGIAK